MKVTTAMNSTTTTSKPNLLIYGETLIDEFPQQKVIGGAPFNVARSLALLGAKPLMITRIGQDADAALIRDEAVRTGLLLDGLQIDAEHPTGRVIVHMDAKENTSAHRFEILPNQAYDYIGSELVDQLLQQYFQETPPDLIYYGSLIQRSATSQQTLISILESDLTEGASKFLDLNLRDGQARLETITSSLNYCDMVKLNEDELQFVLQHCCPAAKDKRLVCESSSLLQACEALMAEFYMQAVIVTLGDKGYFYFDANGVCLHSLQQTPIAVQVVDTVGAGDAFTAMFIHGWQSNWPIEKTIAMANRFAAAICTVRGAVADHLDFYRQFLAQSAD